MEYSFSKINLLLIHFCCFVGISGSLCSRFKVQGSRFQVENWVDTATAPFFGFELDGPPPGPLPRRGSYWKSTFLDYNNVITLVKDLLITFFIK